MLLYTSQPRKQSFFHLCRGKGYFVNKKERGHWTECPLSRELPPPSDPPDVVGRSFTRYVRNGQVPIYAASRCPRSSVLADSLVPRTVSRIFGGSQKFQLFDEELVFI